jgi:hypothetical protein
MPYRGTDRHDASSANFTGYDPTAKPLLFSLLSDFGHLPARASLDGEVQWTSRRDHLRGWFKRAVAFLEFFAATAGASFISPDGRPTIRWNSH